MEAQRFSSFMAVYVRLKTRNVKTTHPRLSDLIFENRNPFSQNGESADGSHLAEPKDSETDACGGSMLARQLNNEWIDDHH